MECKLKAPTASFVDSDSFRLTIWNVNSFERADDCFFATGFRLTIWNVNPFAELAIGLNKAGFRLTIWNVN